MEILFKYSHNNHDRNLIIIFVLVHKNLKLDGTKHVKNKAQSHTKCHFCGLTR